MRPAEGFWSYVAELLACGKGVRPPRLRALAGLASVQPFAVGVGTLHGRTRFAQSARTVVQNAGCRQSLSRGGLLLVTARALTKKILSSYNTSIPSS